MNHSIFEDVKKHVANPKQSFPIVKVGKLGLRRSVLPKDESSRQLVQLDLATATQLHFKAGSLGLTPDELLRRMIWASFAH